MSTVKANHKRCSNCTVIIWKTSGYSKTLHGELDVQYYISSLNKKFVINDILCNKCRQIPDKKVKQSDTEEEEVAQILEDPTNKDPSYNPILRTVANNSNSSQ